MPFTLWDFVAESNRIEGIYKAQQREIDALVEFLEGPSTVDSLVRLVAVFQPGAVLRDRVGFDVRVGDHTPPRGGPHIRAVLEEILQRHQRDPWGHYNYKLSYIMHHEYETLHPFTDGNGRSGRALWLWFMGGIEHAPLGFLHTWYYQSLQCGGKR